VSSFTSIQTFISDNTESRTLGQLFNRKYYLTALYFSQLAYFELDKIEERLEELGALNISIYNNAGTQGYFAEFEDVAIVSFRGTQMNERKDFKTSLVFWKRPFYGVKSHKGYADAIDLLTEQIRDDLNDLNGKRILYTGHSMGGALATLLALVHRPTDICTFGAPRVASGKKFKKHLEGINYQRVVSSYDWVRLLPPNIPGLHPYHHVGLRRIVVGEWDWKDWARSHRVGAYLRALLKEDQPEN
jgi:pimeloyl-ACP methyl ester carboxylesterase